jgi:hypothetical protein
MAKKNKNVDPLEFGGPDLVNDIEGYDGFAPTEEVIDEPEVEDPAEEDEPAIEEFAAVVDEFADRDIAPDDTVFVKVADDLYVAGKVVAVPGEAPCYGLQIKALGNKVVSVHVSRVEKTAEADNVKRRLRFSNKTLKKWATPAE